jgi:hypothetical protein
MINNAVKTQELIFRIRTKESKPLTVYLEPWADKFNLAGTQTLEFTIKGPLHRSPCELIEIHFDADKVIIYDNWPESEMQGRIID